jgi:hypothetical protein
MPKRMVDTELWNNEDIIETFTAEDRYFWLYLLTNPHNSICGVMKASAVLIARDMGYSKECVQNLLYRFENVHKAIYVDKETKELVILNWWKFNWTKSKDLLKTITKNIEKVQSQNIKNLLLDKIGECFGENVDGGKTVLGRCEDGTNTNTHTVPNTPTNTKPKNESKKERTDYDNIINEYTTDDETIDAIFDYVRFFNAKQGRYILNKELRTFLDNLSNMGLLFAESIKGCIANNNLQLAFIENYYELQTDDL